MSPIRVYLDSSDYGAMHKAKPGSEELRVRDALLAMKDAGLIEIGISYYVVFELLQKASPEFRDDRLARARLLTQLCGQNAFPYPTDLGAGYGFSTNGLWVPRIDLEDIEIERVLEHMIEIIARRPELSRHQRKVFSRRRYIAECGRSKPAEFIQLVRGEWPLPFGSEFVEGGDFRRYMLGDLSRDAANKALRFYITDPVTIYELWFECYGRDNPVRDRRDKMTEKLLEMLNGFEGALREQAALKAKIDGALAASGDNALSAEGREALGTLRRKVQSFRSEITCPEELSEHPAWIKLFGRDGALIGSQIFHGLQREKRGVKPSDAIDLIHAMYLPHTDLWRGDKAFSNLLTKNRVRFHERVVPSLAELPERIEAEIARGGQGSGSDDRVQ